MWTQTDLIRFFESFGYRWPFAAEKPMKMGVTPLQRAHTVAPKREHVDIWGSEILEIRDWGCGCCPWHPYSEVLRLLSGGLVTFLPHRHMKMTSSLSAQDALDICINRCCRCSPGLALCSARSVEFSMGMVALLLLRLFCVEALTISSPCHRFNYSTTFLIHTSANLVWSPWLHCRLHTFKKQTH